MCYTVCDNHESGNKKSFWRNDYNETHQNIKYKEPAEYSKKRWMR